MIIVTLVVTLPLEYVKIGEENCKRVERRLALETKAKMRSED